MAEDKQNISEVSALDNKDHELSRHESTAALPAVEETTQGEYANISGRNINTSGGDFIGRDSSLFQGNVNSSNIIIHNYYHSSDSVNDRITAQITRLRGRVTRLIPTKRQLLKLSELRQPSSVLTGFSKFLNTEVKIDEFRVDLTPFTTFRFKAEPRLQQTPEHSDDPRTYLTQLSNIESQITNDSESQSSSELRRNLSSIADEINMEISNINSVFVSFVYSSTSSCELIENIISKIGHQELREEAQMHLGIVIQLASKLKPESLAGEDMDVLSNEAQAAIGVITEIEQRRIIVEKLVRLDRGRRGWTAFAVTCYIVVFIALAIWFYFHTSSHLQLNQKPLSELKLPLFGIPWPVALWSLIGSFAAMIYRFNQRPIYDFGNALKWMLTRPVQGVVLGSTFYLVLVSGLFLLTGSRTARYFRNYKG